MTKLTVGESNLVAHLRDLSLNGVLDAEGADRSENLHRLFMYPAMMVPAAQSAIVRAFASLLPRNAYAIDPFVGSGTSLLSCLESGISVFGQDINPLAVLLAKVKTTKYGIFQLKDKLRVIKDAVSRDKRSEIEVSFVGIDRWFSRKAQIDFSKIRRAIAEEKENKYRRFFWIVLAETVRVGSNDRTSTFKLHRRSSEELEHRDVDVIQKFLDIAECAIKDYELFEAKLAKDQGRKKNGSKHSVEIVWGDTQTKINSKRKFDLLISSPPYGDNHTTVTYGQTSYLPLQWIPASDVECPYDYLRTTQEIDRQSLGGIIMKSSFEKKLIDLFKKTKELKKFYEEIPEEEKNKYKKTIVFISDFDESLDKIVKVMKENSYYIWTIGNRYVGGREVPNAKVLKELMEYHNIKLFFEAERQIFNKKQASKNKYSKTMEREHIMIFHRS